MRAPDFWLHDGPLGRLLAPLGWLYGAGTALRFALAKPFKPGIPVICVGNLVAGGSGKTPIAQALGRRLAARGLDVHLLLRGYGGSEAGPLRVNASRHSASETGDEALLHAREFPTWISRDRAQGARMAEQAGAKALVMDDGHQNPSLVKTLSLIVVDGEVGFGNGRTIPAGPLREPIPSGLARADAVVLLGDDSTGALQGISCPVLKARLKPTAATLGLAGESVVAFAGIGRPAKAFDMLRAIGCKVAATHAFGDHYPYTRDDIVPLIAEAERLGAILVATAKDHVRLPDELKSRVRAVDVEAAFEDEASLDALISARIS
jgi:tetraacyldisaccharide 4'-kinase